MYFILIIFLSLSHTLLESAQHVLSFKSPLSTVTVSLSYALRSFLTKSIHIILALSCPPLKAFSLSLLHHIYIQIHVNRVVLVSYVINLVACDTYIITLQLQADSSVRGLRDIEGYKRTLALRGLIVWIKNRILFRGLCWCRFESMFVFWG